jgi:8-oxo-dGTP diphosphatase
MLKYCSKCGKELSQDGFPQKCANGHLFWSNPLPVGVALQPTEDGRLLAVDRAIRPQGLALPGGFIETGDTWQRGIIREILEETGLDRSSDIDNIEIFDIKSIPDTSQILIFGLLSPMDPNQVPVQEPDEETHGYQFIDRGHIDEIVFDLHQAVIGDWFNS